MPDILGWLPNAIGGVHIHTDFNRQLAAGITGGAAAVLDDISGLRMSRLRKETRPEDDRRETAAVGATGAFIGALAEVGLQANRRRRIRARVREQARAQAEQLRIINRAHIVPTPGGRRLLQ